MEEDLQRRFLGLTAAQKKRVHEFLCAQALEAWTRYAIECAPISYIDSIVGLCHAVDTLLPSDAYHAAFSNIGDTQAIAQRYLEPISALQDGDLEFPGEIEFAYYALYNAFGKYAEGTSTDDWVIVNQALSISKSDVRERLTAALGQAGAV